MRLQHLHIPYPIHYKHSLRLQDKLLERQFEWSAKNLNYAHGKSPSPSSTLPSPPPPTLLTFQTHPTYTVGRRHLKANSLSADQVQFLTSQFPTAGPAGAVKNHTSPREQVTFHPSPRGGLLTYHGPGQLTAYLIYNLRHHGITPRCHIRLLEKAVIRTCARHGVRNTLTTNDPGVWVGETVGELKPTASESDKINAAIEVAGTLKTAIACDAYNVSLKPTDRKICAIGVHVSRGITSHGIGLNVLDVPILSNDHETIRDMDSTDPHQREDERCAKSISDVKSKEADEADGQHRPYRHQWHTSKVEGLEPGYLSWGFGRIVACGLEGKTVTWLAKEKPDGLEPSQPQIGDVAQSLSEEIVTGMTAQGRIRIEGVLRVNEDVLLAD